MYLYLFLHFSRNRQLFFLILIALALITNVSFAQPANRWVHYFHASDGFETLNDVFATADGGYAMAGFTRAGLNHNGYWLVVTDGNGGELWQRTYTDERWISSSNWSYSLIQTDGGGYLIGGRVRDEANNMYFALLRVDAIGDRIWWRTYGAEGLSQCFAVIELKNGGYVAAGRTNGQAYAQKIDADGEILWQNNYPGWKFTAIRETEGGLLFTGGDNDHTAWLIKTDFEGEEIWSRHYSDGWLSAIVSCPEGGFAASGQFNENEGNQGDWYLLRVNDEGQQTWVNTFNFGDNEWSKCLTRLWDGGFASIGHAGPQAPAVLRTDSPGNETWRRLDHNRVDGRGTDEYNSTITGPDNSIIIVGAANAGGERGIDGVLIKIVPDISPPTIWAYLPEEIEFSVLLGDRTDFTIVRAEDAQGDSLLYYWTFDGDTVSTDTSLSVIFEELDNHIVECFVSDGALADSVQWSVHVKEFFIRSFTPDSLDLIIQRGTEIDFGIEIAALEEIEVENTWTLTHRNRQDEEIGNEEAASVAFNQSGHHQLQAITSHEDESDEVTWTINVRSAIWSWWPSDLQIATYVDSTLEFFITPFNEESDSLEYAWILDGESLDSDSASIIITFREVNQYELTSIFHDGIESDTIRWTVDVQEWSFTAEDEDLADLPTTPVLYPASPNPFNSTVNLSFFLPIQDEVRLAIFDLEGREVFAINKHQFTNGTHNIIWNALTASAGMYIANFQCGEVNSWQKLILVK
ncbi:MAG: T9SS type A sorting domain-containing protein [Calditrichaeota bacterium]|nr:T9SS type A sorting domain-containing protein [Calditrichota bacterium]